VDKAVSDYLGLLWRHTLESLVRQRGQAAIDGLPFRIVITVLAIWKPYAEEKMRQTAERAGILDPRIAGKTNLEFVTEPEAAAMATLQDYRSLMKVGTYRSRLFRLARRQHKSAMSSLYVMLVCKTIPPV
jgi:hypothetical protein